MIKTVQEGMNPQEILNELLNTEFKEVKEIYGSIEIAWKTKHRNSLWVRLLQSLHIEMKDRPRRFAWLTHSLDLGYNPVIYFNKLHRDEIEDRLKDILRHECLHFLMGPFATREEFFKEAQKRGIFARRDQY